MIEVFTLLVELGRIEGDGLPKGAVGAAFLIFAPAREEEEAVRDTVRILKEAGLNPLEVTNYGTLTEREHEGYEFAPEELELAEEAARDRSVIILDKQVFYDDDDNGVRN